MRAPIHRKVGFRVQTAVDVIGLDWFTSLPEFMDFILFGKTILVVNKKFGLFLANQLRKRATIGSLSVWSWISGENQAVRNKTRFSSGFHLWVSEGFHLS